MDAQKVVLTMPKPWVSVDKPPELTMGPFDFRFSSIPVLGVCRDGKQMVVRAIREENEPGEPENPVKWLSNCSEGWDVTDYVLYWQHLPDIKGLIGVKIEP